jgi:molybdopterin/thiamine biosynthesis adenylyltransferase
MNSETKQYEQKLKISLQEYFHKIDPHVQVENQWIPFRSEALSKYSPIVDIAIGPFAYRTTQYIEEYDRLSEASSRLIDNLLHSFKLNSKHFSFERAIPDDYRTLNMVNSNARCFMAIEIEKTGTRKHRLGDIVNACSLGRMGIIIAWDTQFLKSFLKITEYFNYLKYKMKPTYETGNLIITTKEQFLESLTLNQQLSHTLDSS